MWHRAGWLLRLLLRDLCGWVSLGLRWTSWLARLGLGSRSGNRSNGLVYWSLGRWGWGLLRYQGRGSGTSKRKLLWDRLRCSRRYMCCLERNLRLLH